ncbi:MAG TPA: DUF5916 domain-containing protein [Gemmatimonadaceae bacterium]
MTRPVVARAALIAWALSLAGAARAQEPGSAAPGGSTQSDAAPARLGARARIEAVRLERSAVRVDGKLDDAAWRGAAWVSDFVQREPDEGAPSTQRTEVAFLYDDDALYVGARMFSDAPDGVRALVTRRDQEGTSEQLVVSLDTYHDRRTAYSFGVTAAGVRLDYFHPSDAQSKRDYTFDPVWVAKVAVHRRGWTAELRIPFAQLRFNTGSSMVWGVNLSRLVPARHEEDYWMLVRRTQTGWASRFGELVGLEGIRRPRHVEVMPYASSEARLLGDVDPADPFVRRRDLIAHTGLDLKAALGSSLTLDATINPDFAQVEADPAEVNLTAFETVFPERRPFFVEGSQLLRTSGLTFFESRRIGQAPHRRPPGDYAERITSTTILGAAKVTGRTSSGLSIGILSAVTARENARIYTSSTRAFGEAPVEPLTGFGVVRLQQELGRSGSTVGLILTDVERDVSRAEPLGQLLARRAYAGALDWNLRLHGGDYSVGGMVGFSRVSGDSLALLRIQRSSAHYFQRPDAARARLDPSRTSLSGHYLSADVNKNAGRWLWSVSGYARSPGLELNDAGRMSTADDWGFAASLYYRHTRPGAHLHGWGIGAQGYREWNFDHVRQLDYVGLSGDLTWSNFSSANIALGTNARVLSDNLTRGGPLMGRPRDWNVALSLSSNPARKTRWTANASYDRDELGGWSASAGAGVSVRPGSRWELSADPQYSWGITSRQFVGALPDGPAATYGTRYLFAFLDRTEMSVRLRLAYALTPDLTLETYAEPFASSGHYDRLGELPAARSFGMREYGANGTTLTRFGTDSIVVTDGAARFAIPDADFNVLSFRSNVVLRWEWRAGSTAYLVWQQRRGSETTSGRPVRPGALWDALSADGDNFLAIKVSYWLGVR